MELDDPIATRFGPLPADIHHELTDMLKIHSPMSAEELFYKWESYCMKMGPETRPTSDSIAAFRKDVMGQLEKAVRAHARTIQTPARRKPPPSGTSGADWMLDELTPSVKRKFDRPHHTPVNVKTPRGPVGEGVGSAFASRKNKGEVVEVLNPQIGRPEMPRLGTDTWNQRVAWSANVEISKFGFRTMHQKLTEASEVCDDQIDDMMDIVREHYNLADEELGNPSTASPSEIIAVGRIVSDAPHGKLNAASVLLEPSRKMGAGIRVPLNLDGVKSFTFFPGQIVAVKGVNASGEYFVVNEILELPLLPMLACPAATRRETAMRLKGGPMSVFVAAGPYTTEDELRFEALDEICSRAGEERPDVVILAGPFVDSEHPLVKMGDYEVESESGKGPLIDLFRERVSSKIRKIEHSLVFLVPTVSDAISPHVAYPQDKLKNKWGLELPKNVRLLTNPATISLNSIVFSISTPDILFHLSSAECRRNPAEPNPITRLSRSLLAQRNFYPLFPPAQGVNLDVPNWRLADFVSFTPDVVLLPSALGATAKVVEGVVVVNPGSASKRRGAGGWVKIWVKEEEEGLEGDAVGNRVFGRVRVEVVRV